MVNLAYRVLKAGTATFVAARFAAGGRRRAAGALRRAADRARRRPRRDAPAARAGALIDRLAACLAGGRDRLGPDAPGADAAPDSDAAGVGDLLEAAGIAYVIAQLLENPPRPTLAGAAAGA